ncbi:single-stranded DNA-binding protein [Bacteroides sp. 51]|uniref:single-stranded DNA-binding protein n=1 Tax=Bacteroides sp. 51 TaxID=2302938 RepID=UPI0013D13B24|nr:single-stranded DNA-binding protein [Bacteroides sp. 51]NDV83427.1 hypothetical protein [Bacteroides sp. 51]
MKVEFIGYLGSDAEYSKEGDKDGIKFQVAETKQGKPDAEGNRKEYTQWINCFRPVVSEDLLRTLKKGTRVFSRGSLRYKAYEGKDKNLGVRLNCRVTELEILSVPKHEVE